MTSFISFILSLVIRFVSIIISIPLGLCGKLYDLLFKKLPDEPHRILITGASSGICKEVALQYAKPVMIDNGTYQGNTLFLIARNKDRLNQVAELAKEKGAVVDTASIDATNEEELSEYILRQDKEAPVRKWYSDDSQLDLIIAGVGVVTPPGASSMSLGKVGVSYLKRIYSCMIS